MESRDGRARLTALADALQSRFPGVSAREEYTFFFARGQAAQDAVAAIRIELPMRDGPSLWFTASLGSVMDDPSDHEHVFFGTYDADDLALTELVAAASHFDRKSERLGYGHTFPLGPASALRARGLAGAVVLEPELDPMFRGPAALLPAALRATLFFLVPLTELELGLKRSEGLDALLERWTADDRYPFSVPPVTGR